MTEKDLIITRSFDAPYKQVWKAWTDPKRMMQWYGPEHFTVPVCKIDLRVGGEHHFCMRSPDGQDYWTTGVYKVIREPETLVYTDAIADENGQKMPAPDKSVTGDWPEENLVTITLEEADQGKTRMTLRHSGVPAGEMRAQTEAGWQGSFDKLVKKPGIICREVNL